MARIKTEHECSNTMDRLIYNRMALKNDSIAMNAMIEVREQRLSEIYRQDLSCLRRMRQK